MKLTPVFRLMAPGRSEDLLHLMVALLRYRVYTSLAEVRYNINIKTKRNVIMNFIINRYNSLPAWKDSIPKRVFQWYIIWKRVPKQCFIKLKIFKIGVYDSVAHFNVGNLVTLLIYGVVGIDKS